MAAAGVNDEAVNTVLDGAGGAKDISAKPLIILFRWSEACSPEDK